MEETLSSEYIYKGRAINLRIDTVKMLRGRNTTREIIEHSDCIAVVVLDNEENVIMVRQYRKPVEKTLLEIPAGGIDTGEQPIDAVKRELQEEIGFIPQKIEELGGFYNAPGYGTEYLYLYLATQLKPSRLNAEDTETIEVVKVPLARIPELIASGEICDAKSIAGLLRVIYLKSKS